MGDKSKIEWTEASWNPIVGCDKVSPGCKNCYAIRDAHRMAGSVNAKIRRAYEGLTEIKGGASNWTGVVRFIKDRLDQPLRWKRPRLIFVNSMSDLFHEDVPDDVIARIFAVMAAAKCHTFQVLTKRASRMRKLTTSDSFENDVWVKAGEFTHAYDGEWPLKNVWLGVSCEDQENANTRIPELLCANAAVRFISAEPLLGQIVITRLENINWLIAGGESGINARPMHPDWARSLRDQCVGADVPFFFKQHGEYVWRETWGESTGVKHVFDDGVFVNKVGKRSAGRILDGTTWDQMPEVAVGA